jgi:hypothetical protein
MVSSGAIVDGVKRLLAVLTLLLGLGLVAGGGAVAVEGYDTMGTCGAINLNVSEADEPGEITHHENLTERQQRAFRRSLNDDDHLVRNVDTTPFNRGAIRYRGTNYEVTPVVQVCDFPPEAVISAGLTVLVLGALFVLGAGLQLRSQYRESD